MLQITPPQERDLTHSLQQWTLIDRFLKNSENPWRRVALTDRMSFCAGAMEILDAATARIYIQLGGDVSHVLVKARAREDNLPFNVFMDELKKQTANDISQKTNWCFSTTGALFAVPFAYIVATKLFNWNDIETDCDVVFVDLEAVRELLAENESKLKE